MAENSFETLLEGRHSCRKFTAEEVSDEEISRIVKAGMLAPTGMNAQDTVFLVVKDPEKLQRLSHLNAQFTPRPNGDPFYGAKAAIVVLAKKDRPTRVYDGSLAMMSMMLEAESLGLGSCWIHRAKEVFDTAEGKQLLGEADIKDEVEGIGNLILGHPAPGGKSVHPIQEEGRVFKL